MRLLPLLPGLTLLVGHLGGTEPAAGPLPHFANRPCGYLIGPGPGQEKPAAQQPPQPLNLHYMRRANYLVASATALPRHAWAGGWAGSGNAARSLPTTAGAEPGTLRVVVEPGGPGPGQHLRIINASADTVLFEAQDSRLYLNLQARNRLGQWQDIEYVPGSWCGNSYHLVYLAPHQYWQLTVPAYTGKIRTMLRAKLVRKAPDDPRKDLVVYSNEFAGGVNPGQFSRKEGHVPAGIMDPYNE